MTGGTLQFIEKQVPDSGGIVLQVLKAGYVNGGTTQRRESKQEQDAKKGMQNRT